MEEPPPYRPFNKMLASYEPLVTSAFKLTFAYHLIIDYVDITTSTNPIVVTLTLVVVRAPRPSSRSASRTFVSLHLPAPVLPHSASPPPAPSSRSASRTLVSLHLPHSASPCSPPPALRFPLFFASRTGLLRSNGR